MIVGVVGAGTMGSGIAQVAARAGHRTLVFDAEPGRAAKACADAAAGFERLLAKGRLSADEAAAAGGRLVAVDTLAELAACGLVVEAIVESLDAKKTLMAELADRVASDAILATNTSSISIDAIAASMPSPGRVIGMHFFNPAPVMRLVEVVYGAATEQAVVDRVCELAERWGKVAVRVASTPGFVVNRVARPFYGEAHRLLEEGAGDAAAIDAVMREAGGFRMGPLELTDLIGQDVNLAVSRSVWEGTGLDPRYTPSSFQRSLVEAGRLGRKSGRGVYRHPGESQEPATEPPRRPPATVYAGPGIGVFAGLVERARRAGVQIDHVDDDGTNPRLELDFPAARARFGAGEPATGRREDKPVVVLDLALDYLTATRLAVAPPLGCPPEALANVVGFLQATGLAVTVLADTPGLVVTRTVARLTNEAVDLVGHGTVSGTEVDTAMRLGANYPIGPLEWGDRIGPSLICQTLDNLESYYRDGRYRPSPFLRRIASAGLSLRGGADRQVPEVRRHEHG
jgi:3-hydroxybutyryl-CoA dehydrogenase